LKMLVGVVIENYTWVHSMETADEVEKSSTISFDDLYRFNEIWELFDVEQTAEVRMTRLRPILYALGSPLGLEEPHSREALITETEREREDEREERREVFLEALVWELSRAKGAVAGVMRFADIFLLLCARVLGLSTFESDYHNAITTGSDWSHTCRANLAIVQSSASQHYQQRHSLKKSLIDNRDEFLTMELEVKSELQLMPDVLSSEKIQVLAKLAVLKQRRVALMHKPLDITVVRSEVTKVQHLMHKLRARPTQDLAEMTQRMINDVRRQLRHERMRQSSDIAGLIANIDEAELRLSKEGLVPHEDPLAPSNGWGDGQGPPQGQDNMRTCGPTGGFGDLFNLSWFGFSTKAADAAAASGAVNPDQDKTNGLDKEMGVATNMEDLYATGVKDPHPELATEGTTDLDPWKDAEEQEKLKQTTD